MSTKAILSKSTFIKDLQCDKNLYLYKHHYNWKDKPSEIQRAYSIKRVLPALVPELSYDGLDIADGGSASVAFEQLQEETDMIKTHKIRMDLLEYCKLDTLAMVEILNRLNEI